MEDYHAIFYHNSTHFFAHIISSPTFEFIFKTYYALRSKAASENFFDSSHPLSLTLEHVKVNKQHTFEAFEKESYIKIALSLFAKSFQRNLFLKRGLYQKGWFKTEP